MNRFLKFFFPLFILVIAAIVFSRFSTSVLPIERLTKTFANTPEYYVVLDDMKEEGNFFTDYFHKYKVVQPDIVTTTNWSQVPKDYYLSYLPVLGMAILSVKDGVIEKNAIPPAYNYVGDARYGRWQSGPSGSIWVFHDRYRKFSDPWGPSFFATDSDFNDFNKAYSKKVPYYGSKNAFGTNGSIVKATKPDFFQRLMEREKMKQLSFSKKFSQAIGRTRSSIRGRGGWFGK